MDFPRILISALRGGSGKTILSIGITAAWKSFGRQITPFKKGPDYIDAGWLALAAGRPCYNLDTFLTQKKLILQSFFLHSIKGDIAVIEGNRGLYDGIDIQGSTSTAELAKLLQTPVILCIDCTKSTRTMAAAVLGCMTFDPDTQIKGVILNRVAGPRHEKVLRKNIEHYCDIPVLGAVPKLDWQNFPERHMGLLPTPEHGWAKDSIQAASQIAGQYLDLEALAAVAGDAGPLPVSAALQEKILAESESLLDSDPKLRPRVGIIKDSAFQFYYPENIEAIDAAGAEIIFISPLDSDTIPSIDALYIGGGFPETHAQQLAQNVTFREQLKSLAKHGLPIYAECGGLMYLGEELVLDETSFPMTGVLPVVFGFSKKPQGHGYTVVTVEQPNPYFKVGTELKGHEFHYSRVVKWRGTDKDLAFNMKRGAGFIHNRDGVCYKNVLATYTHIHALGTPSWAKAMVRNAIAYKNKIAVAIL
ncbi:MAG: cobyrinate a,c-diamide synthase [Deltaproteobacteria bacterium]|nr:cobyrinate a,c-diamide synthase [Deltaproteobacteria bacterium]MBW2014505.1 cobyrinate a,c-diamide synthase [Deltaproteobacteria bacterium]